MVAAAAPYITRTSRAAALRHHAAAVHSSVLHLTTDPSLQLCLACKFHDVFRVFSVHTNLPTPTHTRKYMKRAVHASPDPDSFKLVPPMKSIHTSQAEN
ncbi:hypothetical protein STEG23_010480 [Scotinomys teguina]